MKRTFIVSTLIIILSYCSVYSQKKSTNKPTTQNPTIRSSSGLWSLRLPPSFTITKTHFSATNYVTNEILNTKLHIPDLQPSEKNDTTWNAAQIQCPNGEFATVFGFKGTLGTMQELMIRAEDSRDALAANRNIKREEVFIAYSGTDLFGGLSATTADIGIQVTGKDSLHTHITIATCNGYTYGIIMRASKTMRLGFTNSSSNNYRMIANGFVITSLFNNTIRYKNNTDNWSVEFPINWTSVGKRNAPDPFGVKPAESADPNDTSHWTVLYAQLASSQIEIFVHDSTQPRTKEQFQQDVPRFILNPTPQVMNSITVTSGKEIAGLPTTRMSFIVPRRDDITRQTILVAYKNNTQYFIRGICWDRDSPIMNNLLEEVSKRIVPAP